jgi:DNA-binding NarL/FixJ family response regulator
MDSQNRKLGGSNCREIGRMRIVLVADDRMLRDGLRALFDRDATMEVVAEANCASEAEEMVSQLQPDILLTDIGSWASGNMDMIRQVSRDHPHVRIVGLSAFRNQAFVAEAFRAGIHGYVVKRNGFNELLRAIRTVGSGSTYLCPRIRELILPEYTKSDESGREASEVCLTERESAILQLVSEGQTSKEIALTLDVSSKTIDACRRQLMKKLDVDSVAGLVKCALAMGITTLAS